MHITCLLADRVELWDRILQVIHQSPTSCIYLAGDFNSVIRECERPGRRVVSSRRDLNTFDNLIRDSELIDLPLHGRYYTWYMLNGSSKRRIDRILINEDWMLRWLISYQRGLRRSLSDHCPNILDINDKYWGPKPFRFINAWSSHEGFKEFITGRWSSYDIKGWGGFVLKEKFKRLKEDLKVWNR
ncbi:hypothetical protein ACS0TY_027579 [Phlomoides rotata]